ncbi:ATP-grasp domain-containing protein [Paenibacillus sanguinis]|uniref:ATP-grasp domain-containing protein n=1 Tax=Paenibacillus sanguinis TaxID=225906 RepID=UPI0003821100|nr:ATP-grasp domain-containing protein [Paenibacillus sanguinis]
MIINQDGKWNPEDSAQLQSGQRILITGGRAPVALELARLLHRAGHTVYVAESLDYYLCRSSNVVEGSAVLPAPRPHTQAFLAELERLVIQWRIDLLIPTCEEIFYVAQGLKQLRPFCRVLCPELAVLHRLHHKAEFIHWAAELGFQVPATALLEDEAAWRDVEEQGIGAKARNRVGSVNTPASSLPVDPVMDLMDLSQSASLMSLPLVFKPVYSRFASRVILPERKGQNQYDERSLWTGKQQDTRLGQVRRLSKKAARYRAEAIRELSPSRPWVAQEFIAGQAWCSYSIVHEGKLIAHAAYACHYRTGQSGACVHFQQAEQPAVLDWVKRFTAKIGYTGQISFDFILAENGTLYPIECNPRATSGVHLFEVADGLAEALTQSDIVALSGRVVMPRAGSAAMIQLAMLGSGFKHVRGVRTWRRWMGALRGARDVIRRPEDPGPFTEQLRMMYAIWQRSRRLGITVTQALTEDIEWNGDSK